MKTKLLLLLVLFKSFLCQCQNPNIKSIDYKILTPFKKVNTNEFESYFIALAKVNNGYSLLLENVVTDYTLKSEMITDTNNLSIMLSFSRNRIEKGLNWYDKDKIELKCTRKQPVSDTKGVLFSFELPDSLAYDIKGFSLNEIALKGKGFRIGINITLVKDFFIEYDSKILSKKGSFFNADKYRENSILLYSLLLKKQSEIEKKIGVSEKFKIDNGYRANMPSDTVRFYQVNNGEYEITYRKEIAYKINFYPLEKFKPKPIQLFINDKFPFEFECQNFVDFKRKYYNPNVDHIIYNVFSDRPTHTLGLEFNERFVCKIYAYTEI